jgi:elongation factor G
LAPLASTAGLRRAARLVVAMPRDIRSIRNIGIIAHIDAGKTTLTEGMLFYSGAIHRKGEVDKGTTETDFDVEEQERGITIYSACVSFPWKGRDGIAVNVNLIDTPGHVDFTAEVERSLRVLDGGVVVFSAREGVEAQSETVWRQADKYHVPRIAFINKMDREGADFYGTLKEIRERLGSRPVTIQIPYGAGPPHVTNPFRGVVDLIEMKLLTFSREDDGRTIKASPIPDDIAEDAQLWRSSMLEDLYGFSNEMMELALAEEPISPELIRRVVRDATVHNLIVPVLCGSALHHTGVQLVLDAVKDFLPSPADLPPVEGVDPEKKDKKLKRAANTDEPFCGLVFKIVADKHGDLHFVRVYSGELKANSRALNPGQDKKENVPQLWHVQASHREQVASVEAGDIVGVIGLRHSITGDTLCDPKHPILLESITFPDTVISMAIEPETSGDRKKLADRLEMLRRQDPTFRSSESAETGQTIISGMGELHLEIIKNRLLRDFNLNVKVHKPRVSYKETIERPVEVVGECHRNLGGQNLFAKVKIRLEPNPAGEVVTLGGNAATELPGEYLNATVESLRELLHGGGQLGLPLMKAKVTVLGGETHATESTDVAFRIAAADAFNKALQAAGVVLLEPIMKLEVNTPEEHLGDLVADLQQRRAMITGTTVRGRQTVITAQAPLANLFGYSSAMRSLSQGMATSTMEPSHYGPAPQEVLQSFL